MEFEVRMVDGKGGESETSTESLFESSVKKAGETGKEDPHKTPARI